MGAAASTVSAEKKDLNLIFMCFMPLALKGDDAAAARAQAWGCADPNGNGYCSLAEIDGWIQKSMKLNDVFTKYCTAASLEVNDEADRLWKLYRPSYIRAFNDAKDAKPQKESKGVDSDDYVTRGEFRLMCAYLCIYAAMFDAFNMIDGGSEGTTATDDRRMSLEEWEAGWPKMKGQYGFAAFKDTADDAKEEATPAEVFKAMDADGKGKVLLIEWCKFLEKAEVEAGTLIGRMLKYGDDE